MVLAARTHEHRAHRVLGRRGGGVEVELVTSTGIAMNVERRYICSCEAGGSVFILENHAMVFFTSVYQNTREKSYACISYE